MSNRYIYDFAEVQWPHVPYRHATIFPSSSVFDQLRRVKLREFDLENKGQGHR